MDLVNLHAAGTKAMMEAAWRASPGPTAPGLCSLP